MSLNVSHYRKNFLYNFHKLKWTLLTTNACVCVVRDNLVSIYPLKISLSLLLYWPCKGALKCLEKIECKTYWVKRSRRVFWRRGLLDRRRNSPCWSWGDTTLWTSNDRSSQVAVPMAPSRLVPPPSHLQKLLNVSGNEAQIGFYIVSSKAF